MKKNPVDRPPLARTRMRGLGAKARFRVVPKDSDDLAPFPSMVVRALNHAAQVMVTESMYGPRVRFDIDPVNYDGYIRVWSPVALPSANEYFFAVVWIPAGYDQLD